MIYFWGSGVASVLMYDFCLSHHRMGSGWWLPCCLRLESHLRSCHYFAVFPTALSSVVFLAIFHLALMQIDSGCFRWLSATITAYLIESDHSLTYSFRSLACYSGLRFEGSSFCVLLAQRYSLHEWGLTIECRYCCFRCQEAKRQYYWSTVVISTPQIVDLRSLGLDIRYCSWIAAVLAQLTSYWRKESPLATEDPGDPYWWNLAKSRFAQCHLLEISLTVQFAKVRSPPRHCYCLNPQLSGGPS